MTIKFVHIICPFRQSVPNGVAQMLTVFRSRWSIIAAPLRSPENSGNWSTLRSVYLFLQRLDVRILICPSKPLKDFQRFVPTVLRLISLLGRPVQTTQNEKRVRHTLVELCPFQFADADKVTKAFLAPVSLAHLKCQYPHLVLQRRNAIIVTVQIMIVQV